MTPPNQSSIIFAALVVFLCYFCCGSSRNFVIAMDNDGSSKGATTTTATNFLRRPTDSRVLVVVNDAATVEEKRELMPLASSKCGCSTCTEEVLNADAGGFSCGARINWMVDSLSYIEEDACNSVAGEEFPLVCGGCHTAQCGVHPPSNSPVDEPISRCGCEQCTETIWNTIVTDAGGSFSCGSRIDWIESSMGYEEINACSYVSDEFPGVCTCTCDDAPAVPEPLPTQTPTTNPPTPLPTQTPTTMPPTNSPTEELIVTTPSRCGCEQCTETVWNTIVTDAGGSFSCGSRIDWIESSMGYEEINACSYVSDEFPGVCTCTCVDAPAVPEPLPTQTPTTNPPTPLPTQTPTTTPPTNSPTEEPIVTTPSRCGCKQCTETVWNTIVTDAGGSFSCGTRIDWIETSMGYDELRACSYVSDEFPEACTCACGVTTQPPTPTSGTVKVMSYNTEYTGYNDGRINAFAQKIAEVAADVVGLQECQDPNTLATLAGYTLLPATGSQNYIVYNANRVQQLDSGSMNIPSDNYAQRAITWGKFRILEGSGAGNEFWFFNTHLPHNHGAAADTNTHAMIAQMLLDKRIQLGAGSVPTIVVGDCNPFASSGASNGTFESNLSEGGIEKIYTGTGIFGGYAGLDKIFASEEHWTGIGADVGTGRSDHPAIIADLTLRNDDSIVVGHVGNSIQYYNDCPRIFERLLNFRFQNVKQDSCLRGGANLFSILSNDNGMSGTYSMDEDGTYDIGASTVSELINGSDLDFLIMNDYTQAPVRPDQKQASMEALRTSYVPMLKNKPNPPTVIFIQTAAYKSPVKSSGDLGSFEEFTNKLLQGYEEYAELVRSASGGKIRAKVAPFGLAHLYVKENFGDALWESLYHWDDFHPSPSGTYLEANVLYCTIVGEKPPEEYDVSWYDRTRYFPSGKKPFPTGEEAALLREAAWSVCSQYGRPDFNNDNNDITQCPNGPVTYYPGDLSKTLGGGTLATSTLLVSSGLNGRVLTRAGQRVSLNEGTGQSVDNMHSYTDNAGTVADDIDPSRYYMVANSESGSGGVGILHFDSTKTPHDVIGYRRTAGNTPTGSRNCGGGRTPWGTWLTSEESGSGSVYEVDPNESSTGTDYCRVPIVPEAGGNYESNAFWESSSDNKYHFYTTEDSTLNYRLTRFIPNDTIDTMLSKPRKLDRLCGASGLLSYLQLICTSDCDTSAPSGIYVWTDTRNTSGGDNNDQAYPNAEGIDVKNNELYFVTKVQQRLYIVDLVGDTWTSSATIQSDDCSAFSPDQVARIAGSNSPDNLLYFTEDGGGTQDIHARGKDSNDGEYKFFTIIQGYSNTETVGLTFSLDNKYMYFGHQGNSEIWQIWREDGCSFGNGIYLDVNYHQQIARY